VLIVEVDGPRLAVDLVQMPELPKGLCSSCWNRCVCSFRRPVVPGYQIADQLQLYRLKRQRFGKVKGESRVTDNALFRRPAVLAGGLSH